MKATIHQPDFLPWFGFFHKIAHAEVWVVLDHVENNPRDAAFWGRRVRLLMNGRPTWLSIPLRRPEPPHTLGIPIKDMQINLDLPGAMETCLRTVQAAYGRAPYYKDYRHLADEYFRDVNPSLIARNMRFIRAVMDLLGIPTKTVESSSLGLSSRRTPLLVDILKSIGADTYLCGGGAGGYQQDELFSARGIALEYNTFDHPRYPQMRTEDFVPGLSILDMLFMNGASQVASWIRSS